MLFPFSNNVPVPTLTTDTVSNPSAILPEKVVLLRIEPFPESSNPPARVNGFLYQLSAPLVTELHVRDQVQRDPSATLLDQFRARLKEVGVTLYDVPVRYLYNKECLAPLSWKLTSKQDECIDSTWKQIASGPTLEELKKVWGQ